MNLILLIFIPCVGSLSIHANYKMLLKDLLERKEKKGPSVLYKNDWVSLMSTPEENGNGYIYSHETRCNGNIVAVLLYNEEGKYGVRSEKTPCWGGQAQLSSLTGGVEKGDTPASAVVKELLEESGYICKESDLEVLGTCRGTKSSDTLYHLFALDVSGLKQVKPTGEDVGEIKWLSTRKEMTRVVCPLFYTMVYRLDFR